jgi:rhomboid protease GluP
MFVHAGTVHLLVNVATLVQLGLMLERLLGHLTFTVVYFAAGLFASLVSLTGSPLNVTVGASGAIFGLYGALIASAIWGRLERSSVTIPLHALARLGPAAAVFILYNTTTGSLGGSAESTGFVVGLATGIVLAEGVGDRKPAIGRLGVVTGIAAVLAIAARVPLGAVVDARPEIARVVALEQQLAGAYQPAVERFKNGHMKAEALADLIDQHIVPELKAAQGRLSALGPVPKEHQPLVASAQEYLRLRDESWRLRAEGLHKRNMLTLRQADRTERASLDALERIRKPYPTPR